MPNTPPSQASVVVIGGGVMGCSTLYHLARLGVSDAILLERNRLTSGTTWHSAAQVRALRSSRNMTDLIRYSISLYRDLEAETGQSVGWISEGSISIATRPDRLMHIRRQEALAHLYGVAAECISPDEAAERWPLMRNDDVIGAVWSPDDGRVSPSDLCAALTRGARVRGARIFEDTTVTGILTRGGRIHAVETPAGTIRCDAVAVCAGLWSRRVAAMGGALAPLHPCEHFYLLTQPVDGIAGNLPTLSDHDAHLYIRDDSGGLLVGCFEPVGKAIAAETLGEDFAFQLLPEDWEHFEPMMLNAMHRLPCLEDAGIRMLLNGPESFTPDSAFLLGETAQTRGLYLGCGMNSVGVASGGGAGMALAHCIHHGHPPADLHEVDPARFPDCFGSAKVLAARSPEVLGRHYEISYPNRQWRTARNLRLSPLHDRLKSAGACFGQVAGWERPLCFGGYSEPQATFGKPRWFDQVAAEAGDAFRHAALFDLSTFGKIEVSGRDATGFLDRVCSNGMRLPLERAAYTPLLNERGGIISDLVVLRLGETRYRLTTGTTSLVRDLAWLSRHAEGFGIQLTDRTEELAMIGLTGPQAGEIVRTLDAGALNDLGRLQSASIGIQGISVDALRLSYVGEYGWELTCAVADAPRLYGLLLDAGARPAGSLAQSAMRIEMGYLAYGRDMDTDTTPLNVGLGFAIDWDTEFIGREALLEQRSNCPESRIVTLLFDADASIVPLGNEPVSFAGELVGKTTSAAWGFRVGRPVALADLASAEARRAGTEVDVLIGGNRYLARVASGPAWGGRK